MTAPVRPSGYLKKVLAEDETVLRLARQHWLILFGRIFLWLAALLVMLAAIAWAELKPVEMKPGWTLLYLLLLIPALRIFWLILVWENHQYAITNRRVAQLSGVLNKEVVDSLLEKVNDVKTDQSLMGRIFGYGDLEVLTASEAGKNEFRHISSPLEFKRVMQEAREALGRIDGLA